MRDELSNTEEFATLLEAQVVAEAWRVALDAWSRRVVGWSFDRRPTAAMVNSALGMGQVVGTARHRGKVGSRLVHLSPPVLEIDRIAASCHLPRPGL